MIILKGLLAIAICAALVFAAVMLPTVILLDRWAEMSINHDQAVIAEEVTKQVTVSQTEETKRELFRQATLFAVVDREQEGLTERQALISNVDLKTSWAYVFDDVWTKALIVWLVAIGLGIFHWKGGKNAGKEL